MAPAFPNATVVVPKIAWDTWHSHPERTDYLHEGFLSYLEDLHYNDKLLLSTGLVLPGIGTIWVGGHSICSQFVQVNTERGVALLTGDAVQMYRNLDDNDIIHITDDEALSWKAIEIARVEADILLPGHDPLVREKYPDYFVA
jgi:hypothetical protein